MILRLRILSAAIAVAAVALFTPLAAVAAPNAVIIQTDATALVDGKNMDMKSLAAMIGLNEETPADKTILDKMASLENTNSQLKTLDAQRETLRAQHDAAKNRTARRSIAARISELTERMAGLQALLNPTAAELEKLILARLR